ncbi:phosphodiester glycosidase family protein [Capilliphycus salinus ALCB114379]|uniref:phosphodiester glycosidase family protein n=1 Tax=Capilliphycus salinus TaxID=2768948 RepID=UPI0039A63F80
MNKRFLLKILLRLSLAILLTPALLYLALHLRLPLPTAKQQQLFQGISYQRIRRFKPDALMIHLVKIDLTDPGIKFLVTPGEPGDDRREIAAQTTSDFLQKYDLQLAINGSFFHPFYVKSPINYFPKKGERVKILGQAISNGQIYSNVKKGWSVLCISSENRAQIYPDTCPENTPQGVAGNRILIEKSRPVKFKKFSDYHQKFPRTVVAIDKSGETLWLILIDGRQPLYSEGVTLGTLTDIIMEIEGVETALNLDGGGSTTLVISQGNKPKVLNAPFHSRIPMRQRPIANHLGIYASPLENK